MSTNANIRIKRQDGTQTGIYLHWDGYIEGAGVILQLCYSTSEKVEELLKLGDLSSLQETLETCRAYHRDCGEEFRQSLQDAEFIYTFDEAEQFWIVTTEEYVEKTEAQIDIGLGTVWFKREAILLNEILRVKRYIDDVDFWKTDEFAESGRVSEACVEKAKEARVKINEENNRAWQAYYDAYYN